jgi:hypothetical protein
MTTPPTPSDAKAATVMAAREQGLVDDRAGLVASQAQTLLALQAENARLKDVLAGADVPTNVGSHTSLFVGAVVGLAALAVVSIIVIFLTRPDKDNTGLIAIVLGFMVPLVSAFLAAAVQQVHLAVNSRLSQLVLLTAKAARAQGQLEGPNGGSNGSPVV